MNEKRNDYFRFTQDVKDDRPNAIVICKFADHSEIYGNDALHMKRTVTSELDAEFIDVDGDETLMTVGRFPNTNAGSVGTALQHDGFTVAYIETSDDEDGFAITNVLTPYKGKVQR